MFKYNFRICKLVWKAQENKGMVIYASVGSQVKEWEFIFNHICRSEVDGSTVLYIKGPLYHVTELCERVL